jgi:MoaA/NifB/PqqE/SkfB family radical SAM enzyme
MMTPEMAKKIVKFSESNGVLIYNIMGGEFFCNPRWHEILDIFLSSEVLFVRLVSNGDWYGRRDVKELLSDLFERYQVKFKISISKDKFHKNSWLDSDLLGFLKMTKGKYNVGTMDNMAVVPIGRAWLEYSFYSIAKYCDNPENKYSFLIDEEGQIYKCGFGVLPYANISEFLEGGFRKVFKEVSQKFYGQFLLTCRQCIGAYEDNKSMVERRGFKLLRRE